MKLRCTVLVWQCVDFHCTCVPSTRPSYANIRRSPALTQVVTPRKIAELAASWEEKQRERAADEAALNKKGNIMQVRMREAIDYCWCRVPLPTTTFNGRARL